ncbi:MAG: substrate-binding domain-containing protein, partial [Leptolyngbyaceae bacterium]|nr:substrate-binding domain-containing protein [Leptolyngbyaceae bacterium]
MVSINPKSKVQNPKSPSRLYTSLGIILAALGLTYVPLPGSNHKIVVVSGTELQEPLQVLETRFEQEYPHIQIDLKFQGSQDIVNKYIDDKNDFNPTVLIPANGEILKELGDRWRTQNSDEPFYDTPQPIAKTFL